MKLDDVLKRSRKVEMSAINLRVPLSLKTDFEAFCNEHDVSMTKMILALIEIELEKQKDGVK